jgi:hypothetical protein
LSWFSALVSSCSFIEPAGHSSHEDSDVCRAGFEAGSERYLRGFGE